jgi:hypothetical protein
MEMDGRKDGRKGKRKEKAEMRVVTIKYLTTSAATVYSYTNYKRANLKRVIKHVLSMVAVSAAIYRCCIN